MVKTISFSGELKDDDGNNLAEIKNTVLSLWVTVESEILFVLNSFASYLPFQDTPIICQI